MAEMTYYDDEHNFLCLGSCPFTINLVMRNLIKKPTQH